MRWVTGTAIVGVVIAGSVAALVAAGPMGQEKDKAGDKAPAHKKEVQVRVTPQIQILGGGPEIGVSLKDLDDAEAKAHKVVGSDGVLVQEVREGSAAEKGGIKSGDVIREYDGEHVRSARHLQRLVTESTPGRTVKIVVSRDGKDVTLSVTPRESEMPFRVGSGGGTFVPDQLQRDLERDLGDLPRSFNFRYYTPDEQAPGDIIPMPRRQPRPDRDLAPFLAPRMPRYEWTPGAGRLGVSVQELSPQLRDYFGTKDGVLVATVNPDTPASRAGIKAGDVITSVNGKSIDSVNQLVSELGKATGSEDVPVVVWRDHKSVTLKVRLAPAGRGVGTPT